MAIWMPLFPMVTEPAAMTVPEASGIVTVLGNVIPPEEGKIDDGAVTEIVAEPVIEPVKPSGSVTAALPFPLMAIGPVVLGQVPKSTVPPFTKMPFSAVMAFAPVSVRVLPDVTAKIMLSALTAVSSAMEQSSVTMTRTGAVVAAVQSAGAFSQASSLQLPPAAVETEAITVATSSCVVLYDVADALCLTGL